MASVELFGFHSVWHSSQVCSGQLLMLANDVPKPRAVFYLVLEIPEGFVEYVVQLRQEAVIDGWKEMVQGVLPEMSKHKELRVS